MAVSLQPHTAPRLLTEPAALRARLAELDERLAGKILDAVAMEALAEGRFRLALHPDTPVAEATKLLLECIQLDGVNPKYAYHIARLYFVHGEFEAAQRWLGRACRQCPTSHRIWTHIALLQFELNRRYYGDERYEPDALRKRAEQVAGAIQAGEDRMDGAWLDFVPPESRAEREKRARQSGGATTVDGETDQTRGKEDGRWRPSRTDRPNQCRWSGIKDISAEQLLEGSPSQRTVERIGPLLEEVALHAHSRRGGVAAFVILSCAWLVRGYPSSTIRRLMETVSSDAAWPPPSLRLLRRVCDLCEMEERDATRALGRWLSEGKLPPVLTALLHQQLLLWRPQEFRNTRAFQAAQQFLVSARLRKVESETDRQEIAETLNELSGKLKTALAALEPEPPRTLQDFHTQTEEGGLSAEAALDAFAEAEAAAGQLEGLRDEAFAYLKGRLVPAAKTPEDATHYAQIAADVGFFPTVIDALSAAADRIVERLDIVAGAVEQLDSSRMPDDFQQRNEASRKAVTAVLNLGNFRKLMKRAEKALATGGDAFADAPPAEPSEAVSRIHDTAANLCVGTLKTLEAAPSPEEGLAALERAASTLEEARGAAYAYFKETLTPAAKAADDQEAFAQAIADRNAFDDILTGLTEGGQRGLEELETLVHRVGHLEASERPADFNQRKEACDKRFKEVVNLGNFRRGLKKVDKHLRALPADEVAPAPVSQDVAGLLGTIRHVFDDASSEASVSHSAADLQSRAEELSARAAELWNGLKELTSAKREGALDANQQDQARALREEVDAVLDQSTSALSDLAEARTASMIEADELPLLDEAEKTLLAVGQRRGPFLKAFKKLRLDTPESEPKPGAEIGAEESTEPAQRPKSDLAGLAELVRETNRKVRERFNHDLDTFGYYPAWTRLIPPIQALRSSIRARQAETLYRMGDRRTARGIWQWLVREDRLEPAVLKNIAVCDTGDGLSLRASESWRAYAESVYLYDALLGRPQAHAEDRERFHRAMGGAFATPVFFRESLNESPSKTEEDQAIAFVSSARRVRTFIDQLCLQFLNAHLMYRSASLTLGVNRTDDAAARQNAYDRLIAFADGAVETLPRRIAPATKAMVHAHLQRALDATTGEARRQLEADRAYADEKDRHLNMLAAICRLKFQVFKLFSQNERFISGMTSVDFLEAFERLDGLPIDLNGGFLAAAAGSAGLPDDMIVDLMSTMKSHVVQGLMTYILDVEDESKASQRKRQYERLTSEWGYHPALADMVERVDSAIDFLPQADVEKIMNRQSDSALVDKLMRLHEMYPAFCGLARYLASLLLDRNRMGEAAEVLERSAEAGFYPEGVRSAKKDGLTLKAKVHLENEEYMEAVRAAIELVQLDHADPNMPQQLVNIALEAAHRLERDPGIASILEHVNAWVDRANKLLDAWKPDEADQEPPFTREQIIEIVKLRDQAAADLTFFAAGGASSSPDPNKLLREMNDIIRVYPSSTRGYLRRISVRFMMANQAAQQGDRQGMQSNLNKAKADAELLLKTSEDAAEREEAEKAIAEADRALGQL